MLPLCWCSTRVSARASPAASNSLQILHIPREFAAKEGTQLTEGLYVGKHLAHGLQVNAVTRLPLPQNGLARPRPQAMMLPDFARLHTSYRTRRNIASHHLRDSRRVTMLSRLGQLCRTKQRPIGPLVDGCQRFWLYVAWTSAIC